MLSPLWCTAKPSAYRVYQTGNSDPTRTEANRFLEETYLDQPNAHFAVVPEGNSLFVLVGDTTYLDAILCVKHKWKTDAADVFSFQNRCFQILDAGVPLISARKKTTVLAHPNRRIRMEYQGRIYDTIRYLKRS